jgi:hypothetical protein
MAYRCWGERFLTSDFSGAPRVFQPVYFPENFELKAIRTWVCVQGSPTLTTLSMRVYSNVSLSPGQVIATASNTWTKAQITAAANAAREIYFEFDRTISLKGGDRYHFAPWISGYTGAFDSHISWIKGFPDPVIDGSLEIVPEKIAILPYKVAFIGAEL